MVTPFQLRSAAAADTPELARLLAAVWPGHQTAIAYHGAGRVAGTVAVLGGKIVGYAHATSKRLHPLHTYVGVHVLQDFRCQGVGAALWDDITAPLTGTLKTATDAVNRPALQFLRRRGLSVSLATYDATLDLTALSADELMCRQRPARNAGFAWQALSSMSGPGLRAQVTDLHRQVYAHTHRHDPPDTQ